MSGRVLRTGIFISKQLKHKKMKQILITVIMVAFGVGAYTYYGSKPEKSIPLQNIREIQRPIRVVYYQDITRSIERFGIEIASSATFKPFFECTDRDIELHYGVISRSSARKLISLNLPAFRSVRPEVPDVTSFSITEKARKGREYEHAFSKYLDDSTAYYRFRAVRITNFSRKIDSLTTALNIPREQRSTDVITAIDVADKAFNVRDSAESYLLLNSDGLDNQSNSIAKLNNKATVILINAGRYLKTPVDGIEPIGFQSSEQALQFILNSKTVSYGK